MKKTQVIAMYVLLLVTADVAASGYTSVVSSDRTYGVQSSLPLQSTQKIQASVPDKNMNEFAALPSEGKWPDGSSWVVDVVLHPEDNTEDQSKSAFLRVAAMCKVCRSAYTPLLLTQASTVKSVKIFDLAGNSYRHDQYKMATNRARIRPKIISNDRIQKNGLLMSNPRAAEPRRTIPRAVNMDSTIDGMLFPVALVQVEDSKKLDNIRTLTSHESIFLVALPTPKNPDRLEIIWRYLLSERRENGSGRSTLNPILFFRSEDAAPQSPLSIELSQVFMSARIPGSVGAKRPGPPMQRIFKYDEKTGIFSFKTQSY